MCFKLQWDEVRLRKPQPNVLYCCQLHLLSVPLVFLSWLSCFFHTQTDVPFFPLRMERFICNCSTVQSESTMTMTHFWSSLSTSAQWVQNETVTKSLKHSFRFIFASITNKHCSSFSMSSPRLNRQNVIEHVNINLKWRSSKWKGSLIMMSPQRIIIWICSFPRRFIASFSTLFSCPTHKLTALIHSQCSNYSVFIKEARDTHCKLLVLHQTQTS